MQAPVLVSKHIHNLRRSPVIHVRGNDTCPFRRGVDNPSIADIDSHMIDSAAATVKDQIPGPGLLGGDGPSLSGLGSSSAV